MSSGGGGDSTTSVSLSPEQRSLINLTQPVFEGIVQQPPQLFPGSGVAGTTPLQEAGQQAALANAAGPAQDSINNLLNLQAFLSGPALFPSSNPALQDAIQAGTRPLERTFETTIIPQIARSAQAAGQVGSSRQGIAEGLAAENLQTQVGDVSARIASQGFGQGLDAATRALAFGPSTASASFLPSTAIEAIGAQQAQGQQQFLSEAENRFFLEQIIPFLVAKDVASIAFGAPGGSTSTSLPGTSTGQQLLGGASLGAALGPAFGAGPAVGPAVGALAGLALL